MTEQQKEVLTELAKMYRAMQWRKEEAQRIYWELEEYWEKTARPTLFFYEHPPTPEQTHLKEAISDNAVFVEVMGVTHQFFFDLEEYSSPTIKRIATPLTVTEEQP